MTYDNYSNFFGFNPYCCPPPFMANNQDAPMPHVVSGGINKVIYVTNNRAKYYSELAQKYRDEAKDLRDSAKYYAEQNSDVTMSYVNALEARLQRSIDGKQASGSYALTTDIPTDNNQLTNGAGYITGIDSTAVTTALGFTPYNSTNPDGYLTSSGITGKADVDLTNLNNAGTATGAGLALPSDTYDELTIGASGTTYTAPANGWFAAVGHASNSNAGIGLFTSNNLGSTASLQGFLAGMANIPVKKGESVELRYNSTPYSFRFIYAVGSEWEK